MGAGKLAPAPTMVFDDEPPPDALPVLPPPQAATAALKTATAAIPTATRHMLPLFFIP